MLIAAFRASAQGPRVRRFTIAALAGFIATGAFAAKSVPAPNLTAARIVEKNAAARGGLEAWRKIQTMAWVGHIESANAPAPTLPFVLELKRPNKTRFEIVALNQKSMRIYDGSNGWKVRPSSSGKPELQPYTAGELKFARDEFVIDGPLMDYAAKGVAVTLGGVDEVEGRKAYRLDVRLPSGSSHCHLWIDAETFLDLKLVRETRSPLGQLVAVSVYYRNYQTIEGLQIPLTIESAAATAKAMDKLVIERVSLNPPLPDRMFAKPGVLGAPRNAVTVDTRVPQTASRPVQPAP